MKLMIYTDGSSRGNPGRGGWGAAAIGEEIVHEWGGGEKFTTNNRMEMTAVLEALSYGVDNEGTHLIIKTDSEYTMKGATVWIKGWKKNAWKTSAKKDVLNKDLWIQIDNQMTTLSQLGCVVQFVHVRGHAGEKYNERVDQIATSFADASSLHLYSGSRSNYI